MELEAFISKLESLKTEVLENVMFNASIPAMNLTLAKFENRIFKDGKDSNGNDLSAYSNKKGYYTKEQFVKKGAFKSKKKTMKIERGYEELRSIQGRSTKKNLDYTGSLRSGIKLRFDRDKMESIIGIDASEYENNSKRKSKSEKNKISESKKAKYLEEQEGTKIFTLSEQEVETLKNNLEKGVAYELKILIN